MFRSFHRGHTIPTLKLSSREPLRVVFCLALAAAGGLAADFADVPLPYMLGALAVTMAAAMAGWPISRPTNHFVVPMRIVLGVLIGSAVTPDLLARAGAIAGTAVFVPVYVILAGLFGTAYYHKVAGLPLDEAFFCALPGGLLIMTTLADDVGMDIKRISLAHSLRIAFVVASMPFLAQLFLDVDAVDVSNIAKGFLSIAPQDFLLLALAGIVGWGIATWTNFPAGQIIGPLFVSALLHVFGITDSKPPQELIYASQTILGAYIGSRFVGETMTLVRAAVLHALGHVAVMLALSIAMAFLLHWLFGLDLMTGVMCFTPGGLTENSLIAFGLGLEVAFIATVQVTRLLFISLLAPLFYLRVKAYLHQ